MQNLLAVAFAFAAFVIGAFAQDDVPSFKAEARSAPVSSAEQSELVQADSSRGRGMEPR